MRWLLTFGIITKGARVPILVRRMADRGLVMSSEVGRFEGALTPNVSTYKESFTLIRDMLKGKEVSSQTWPQ